MVDQKGPLFDTLEASRLMAEAGIDVILANSKPNVGYLADYYYYEGLPDFMMEDGQSFYEAFVGIPKDESALPFMVGCTGEEGYLNWIDPWIQDRKIWGPQFVVTNGLKQTNLYPNPIRAVVNALSERGLESACIGVEMGQIKHIHQAKLKELLPQASFKNADPILWQLRLVKTHEEISRIKVACQAISQAADVAFRSAFLGMTELEMEKIVNKTLIEEGCTPINFIIGFGPKGAYLVAPTNAQLEKGQLIRFDIVAEYKGYVGDISRVSAFGQVDERAERAHKIILEANIAMREAAKPGTTCTDLRKLELDIFSKQSLTPLIPMAGHGVGRTVHEHPFMVAGDHTEFVPGMTLAIEPTIRLDGVGSVNIEDTIVITETGAESLTTAPRGLYHYA